MTGQPVQSSEWTTCEPGLLTGHARRLRRRQLLLLAAKTCGSVGCLAAVGFGGWFAYQHQLEADRRYAGLTCSEVRKLMPAYRLRTLDPKGSKVLEEHVRRCSNCAEFRAELHRET